MSSTVLTAIDAPDPRNLRRRAQGAWTLYDFANTIFSFAIVSGAMGQWLVAERTASSSGRLCSASRSSRASASTPSSRRSSAPSRTGRPAPAVPARVHRAVRRADGVHRRSPDPVAGALLFVVANFSYQAALIYYDSSIKLVSTPATRGRLSGIGTGIGYCGTVFVALLIQFGQIPLEARFPLAAVLYALFAIPVFGLVREPPRPARPSRGGTSSTPWRSCPGRGGTPARSNT